MLRRLGLGRLPPALLRPAVVRYERATPGELLHVHAKRLGRIVVVGHRIAGDRTARGRCFGWEHLHVAVDDASRVAHAERLPDETAARAVTFLEHAVAWLAALGMRVERVMTDNAFCYTQRTYAAAVQRLDLRHLRPRPYTPRTNGKAERFIQTALREWASVNRTAPPADALARSARSSQPTTPRGPTRRTADVRRSAASRREQPLGWRPLAQRLAGRAHPSGREPRVDRPGAGPHNQEEQRTEQHRPVGTRLVRHAPEAAALEIRERERTESLA